MGGGARPGRLRGGVACPPQGEGGPLAVDEVPERSTAFPPQGEGGPLAVDEVPAKRIKDSIVSGQVGQKVRPLVFARLGVPCPIV